MTIQRCSLYAIVFMMAISSMATVVQGSAQVHDWNTSRNNAQGQRERAESHGRIIKAKCEATRDCTSPRLKPAFKACLRKIMPTRLRPKPPQPCVDHSHRRLLQEAGDLWDEFMFDCTTACTDPDNCIECDDTLAGECGEVLSNATEDDFDTYTNPDEGWTAKCALAAEKTDPDLGTQCALCFFDILDPSAATGTPSAGSRSVHGHYIASSVLLVVLAGVGVVLPV